MSDVQLLMQAVDGDFLMNALQGAMAAGCVLCMLLACVVGVLDYFNAK